LKEIISYGSKVVPYLEDILRRALQKGVARKLKTPQNNSDWLVVVQAFYLLAHLRAEDSLDLVLEFLSQKQEILDYWLHDLLTDDVWEVIFYLGQNQLNKLQAFVLNPNHNIFARLAICTALVQIGLHIESKKDQVIAIFKKVLDLENEETDFIGLVVSELLDLNEEALRPALLRALEKNDVWSGIISPIEVNRSYASKHARKLNPLDIFERYKLFNQYPCFAKSPAAKTPQKIKLRKLHNLL
ncbi:MAG: DUF1186 domain-containing protein, partial [bacterium]